jgi:methionyl-tRNA formyltransferase
MDVAGVTGRHRCAARASKVMEDQVMSRSLRVLLFAHHQAGIAAFHGLRDAGHEIAACITHRSKESWVPSLTEACHAAGVPVTEEMPEPVSAQRYREGRPDLIVSVGYRKRVSLPFLALPRWGAINAHFGPLPGYRGGAAIPWGILKRESSWAVTVHAMTHNYNEGGVLRRQAVALRENDNAYDLFVRCSQVAARTMVETVNDVASGGGDLVAQDLRDVRYYEAGVPFGGKMDWNQPADCLAAFVRAMDFGRGHVDGLYEHLAPPARATLKGQEVGIWRARAGGTVSAYPPGTITRTEGELWVQTGRGHLVIERVVDAQGKDLDGMAFCEAHGVEAGQTFEAKQVWREGEAMKLSHAA